jgi:hypothetical protein
MSHRPLASAAAIVFALLGCATTPNPMRAKLVPLVPIIFEPPAPPCPHDHQPKGWRCRPVYTAED